MLFIFILSDSGQRFISVIYQKYYKRMLYTAVQLLGTDNGEEAVHDVFIKIIKITEKNEEFFTDKPGQYFVIMVKNHSLNVLRKERMAPLPLDEDILENDIFQLPTGNPEDSLLSDEAMDRLITLIRCLTPATRQVMEYRYIEEYTNKEIADILGISQSAVSSRISDARKQLKELFEQGEVQTGNAY